MDCMKHEMNSWDRERRARRFAAGWVLVMIALGWLVAVPNDLAKFAVGGVLLAAGIVLIGSGR
jgi:hypothetical protein